jgi:hypothetical protein
MNSFFAYLAVYLVLVYIPMRFMDGLEVFKELEMLIMRNENNLQIGKRVIQVLKTLFNCFIAMPVAGLIAFGMSFSFVPFLILAILVGHLVSGLSFGPNSFLGIFFLTLIGLISAEIGGRWFTSK